MTVGVCMGYDSELCQAGDCAWAGFAESFAVRQHDYGLWSGQQQQVYADNQLEEGQPGLQSVYVH